MLATVQRYYPKAVSSRDFILHTFAAIRQQLGLDPSQLLLAHAICSDDVNSIEYPEEGRAMLGPFNLGGLDGYPFAGLTGMAAFANHIPTEGAALVFYAPHIGINEAGDIGKLRRVGQDHDSGCCGAALLALSRLTNGQIKTGPKSDLDFQQETLQQFLLAEQERILAAEYPLQETTSVIYEASERCIDELIKKTSFLGRYIIVMGAIIINADHQFGSFLQLRRFEVLDVKTKEKLYELSFEATLE